MESQLEKVNQIYLNFIKLEIELKIFERKKSWRISSTFASKNSDNKVTLF